jgi:hypothetical protein
MTEQETGTFRWRATGSCLSAYLEPPHRLDWDFVAERHKAVCYDAADR